MDWHKNLVPPWNEIWASQSIPNPLISVGGGGGGANNSQSIQTRPTMDVNFVGNP